MGVFDWLFAFASKMLAVPELSALLPAIGVGLAITYLATLAFPASTAIQTVQRWSWVIVILAVVCVATWLMPTPRMALWSFTVAVFIPPGFDKATAWIYHRWDWLKPKALLTAPEMQARGDK